MSILKEANKLSKYLKIKKVYLYNNKLIFIII